MKVLFQSRVDLYDPRGGDTTQIENTKNYIEEIYPDIKITINNDLSVDNISDYDIVHLFNLDWICETYPQAMWAKKHNKKIVLSAIHHSEKEVLKYENLYRYDFRRIYNFLIPSQAYRDMGKNIYRGIFDSRKLSPAVKQFIYGIRNQQREILNVADLIFIQTNQEAKDIIVDFGVNINSDKFVKVVNGINSKIFRSSNNNQFLKKVEELYGISLADKKIILNVGRIEPRKNQLTLIQAFNNIKNKPGFENYFLVFIGDYGRRSPEYLMRFKGSINPNGRVTYIPSMPQTFIASAMSHSGIYVQPSWFETTGLVALEAAACGMYVVASGDRIKEYLGDAMISCDPSNVGSVQNGILEALYQQNNYVSAVAHNSKGEVLKMITEKYTWEEAAKQTVEAYRKLVL